MGGDVLREPETVTAPRSQAGDAERGLELCVVIPTLNEAANIERLIVRLEAALAGVAWEAVIVDDNSSDGTADIARRLGRFDRRVRCLQRIGRRGLASAYLEGALATAAPLCLVIDGDLQHDERIIPEMLARMSEDGADLVIGSRFVDGGGVGDWSEDRQLKSRLATALSQRFIGEDVTDPMSGFFLARTSFIREVGPKLTGVGFKILLDILLSAGRKLTIAEVGYTFGARTAGESKLDTVVALELLILLYAKTAGRILPARFALFGLIGGLGLGVHMAVLAGLYVWRDAGFVSAQASATMAAMTFNFFLNNQLTYRDQRLKGARALFIGWLSFCAVCSVGALANVGVAAFLHEAQNTAWTVSALAGVAIGAVWNYALSSRFTWGRY